MKVLVFFALLVTGKASSSWSSSRPEEKNLTATEKLCKEKGLNSHVRGYSEHETRGRWSPDSYLNNYNGGERLFLDEPCASARSNPRAMYTSHLIPCAFSFHAVPEEESGLGPLELSSRCSDRNQVSQGTTTVKDYVINWPDECVGDFQRCYSVERDEISYLQTFCEKHWNIPDGVTHVAVDCRLDKNQKETMIQQHQREWADKREKEQAYRDYAASTKKDPLIQEQQSYFELHQREVREYVALALFCMLVLIGFCSASMFCVYKTVLQPIYFGGSNKTDHHDSFEMHTRMYPSTPPRAASNMSMGLNPSPSNGADTLSYRLLQQPQVQGS